MVPVGPLFNRFKRSVRDIAAELGKKVRLEMIGERTELDKRMIDELGDPLVTEEHITAFNWASHQELDDIIAMTLRINDFLTGLFAGARIKLVDFKVEYGRLYEGEMVRTVLADEISPDSCRLWDMDTGEKMDKDRFRRDLGGVTEAYAEVARRLGIIKEAGGAEILSFNGK
jgi:phosphoribosylaminoimidazole-succinocarboxamide synthase